MLPTTQEEWDAAVLPPEKGLLDLYKRYLKANTPASRGECLCAIFEQHAFVKKKAPRIEEFEHHIFSIVGFGLNIRAFQKWLKRRPKFKKIAGGVSDDGIYTVSTLLRETLPRGFHHITATNKKTGEARGMVFRGIPKFTGMGPGDEDELSNSTDSNFFFEGNTLKDAQTFLKTEKSNGENAKLGMRRLDGVLYLVSGSKNMCSFWPAYRPVPKPKEKLYPGEWIQKVFSDWFLHSLPNDESRGIVTRAMLRMGTLMGEVNTPWFEHIYPINELMIEVYSVLDFDGRPWEATECFALFRKIGIQQTLRPPKAGTLSHVRYSEHTIEELDGVVNATRKSRMSEGAVLYFIDSIGKTIGMCKVKTSEYVVQRRLRESFRGSLWNPLTQNKVEGYRVNYKKQASDPKDDFSGPLERPYSDPPLLYPLGQFLTTARDRLTNGMRKLHWVPGCSALHKSWTEYCHGFVEWWVEKKLLPTADADAPMEDLMKVLAETRGKYGSLLMQYRAESGQDLNFDVK